MENHGRETVAGSLTGQKVQVGDQQKAETADVTAQ
jgi:hypothetical protein